jgi:CRP-like cAMP-binding protein
MMQTKDYQPRAFIFHEFETGQKAFIIKSGLVEMTQTVLHDGEEKKS